jgi:hypothetical protein
MNRRAQNRFHKYSVYFPQTEWKYVGPSCNTPEAHKAGQGYFAKHYWIPLHSYLVAKGYSEAAADDLVQGFMTDKVMAGRFLQKADQEKGRFRTVLLAALNNYIIDFHRSQKRNMAHACQSLDENEQPGSEVGDLSDSPENIYNRAWAQTLVSEALQQVQQQSAKDRYYWEVFEDRVLNPIILDKKPVSLAQLCKKYKISSPMTISNMIVTMKRRFQKSLSCVIKKYEQDVPQEIENMITAFSA